MKTKAPLQLDLLAQNPGCEALADLELSGFGSLEGDEGGRWRWLFAPEAELRAGSSPLHGWKFRARFRFPAPGLTFSLFWNSELIAKHQSESVGEVLYLDRELPATGGAWSLRLAGSLWRNAAPDPRPLSVSVEAFRMEPAFATEGKVCPYPFSRMEFPGEPFIPCCHSWLAESYHRLDAGEDPWNGPAAQALRESILDGSYRYCRLERCRTTLVAREELRAFAEEPGELPISEKNLAALERKEVVLPDGPSAATLMGDPRCNLACASCRKEKITALGESEAARVSSMRKLLDRHGPGLKILKVAGDGEVFFSEDLRKIVKESGKWEKLEKLDILSNGILATEKVLEELEPGSRKIRSVNISLDAGEEETYRLVRGGDWNRLVKNLRWISAERRKGRFDFFALTFVLRAGNLASFRPFLELAAELGVDEVYVSQLFPWERMLVSFEEEAIHLPAHPRHGEFLAVWEEEKNRVRPFALRASLP